MLAFSRLVASGVDSADALGRVFFSLEFPDLDGIEGRRWVSQDPGRSRRTSDS